MMGEQRQGGKGASWRALGAMVLPDHILRRIDRLLNMTELRDALAEHHSAKGRPSIAPELLIRSMRPVWAVPPDSDMRSSWSEH